MLFYYPTSKENAKSIKRDGFSSEYINKKTKYGKAINFTDSYVKAQSLIDSNGEILKVNINKINSLKLNKIYNIDNDNHINEIQRILMYLKFNSDKNCIINTDEYVFFKSFEYDILK